MARRRGGAPQAAEGDFWRRQQQLTALTTVLMQLSQGDGVPRALFRGLHRVMTCVQHTLQGLPCGNGAAVAVENGTVSDGGGSGGFGADSADASSTGRPEDKIIKSGKWDSFEHYSLGNEERPGLGGSSVEELLAAERAVEILQDVLASLTAQNNVDDGSSGWDSVSYVTTLMHSYVALSSDLFDTVSLRANDVTKIVADSHDCGYGWTEFYRDELAAPARRKLPACIYAHIVRAMGWITPMLELLVWIPDPWVASAALARIIELCPDLAPVLAGMLVWNAGSCGKDTCDAPANPMQRTAGGWVTHPPWELAGFTSWSFHWLSQVSYSPVVALRFAKVVREMAGAAIATTAAHGVITNAPDGRRWLTCLLLLGRTLTEALRRQAAPPANTDVVTATGRQEDDVTWIDECCEALQEGLCAWQADILAHDAATRTAGPGAETATDLTTAALLQLIQGELRDFLNDQQVAGATDRPASPRCLLSSGSVIRLRTRIMLLTMQAAATGAEAQPPHPPWPSSGDRKSVDIIAASKTQCKELFPGRHRSINAATKLVAGDVWPCVGSSIEPPTDKLVDESGKITKPEVTAGARSDNLASAPPTLLVAAGSQVSEPPEARMRRLPEWLRAATAATTTAPARLSRGDGGNLLKVLSSGTGNALRSSILALPQLQETVVGSPQRDAASALTARAVAISVALLTPGSGSWLRVQRDQRIGAAAGPEPYSPFRMALALLELLQGWLHGCGFLTEIDQSAAGAVTAAAGDTHGPAVSGSDPEHAAEKREPEKQHMHPQDVETVQQLEFRMLRMVAECLACVEKPEQQDALQAVVISAPSFRSLRTRLANDAALQAAAGRALVALSNRAAAVDGSLDYLALSAQQEAQRLAAAATDLLPYAVLTPEVCVRRLVLDGLTHPGQQPWVLQLLRCFAVAAAAPAAAAAAEMRTAKPPSSVLLSCLRDVVLQDAARWLQTTTEKRSLLGLLNSLMRLGLLTAHQVLLALVEPGLSADENRQHRPIVQVHCALLIAQFVLGGPGAGGDLPIISYCCMAELAAACPARLMLATAEALRNLYNAYDSTGRLESPVLDAAVAVLERSVLLYSNYIRNGDGGKHVLANGQRNGTRELVELAAGCGGLPRRLTFILLPLLELAASSAVAASQTPSGAGKGAGDDVVDGGDDGDGTGSWIRALAATFVPAAAWRPRSLRSANAASARAVMFDTLTFAASSVANAAALRHALLDGAEDEEQEEGLEESSNDEVATKLWLAWGAEVMFDDTAVVVAAPARQHGVITEGQVGRHVAATMARGVPQLPAIRLMEGCISAMSDLLPTAAPEQARRLLLGLLPAVVRAAGGVAALHAVIQNSGGSAAAIVTAGAAGTSAQAISVEAFRMWFLAAPVRRCSAPAAAVATSMVVACRAAEVALRRVALMKSSACVSAGTAEAEATERMPLSPLAVRATADRCAAHLAMLASRLAIAATAATAADSAARLDRDALPATLATVPPKRPPAADGQATLEVAAISVVLLSELCSVASAAAEVAVPGDDRAMDLWQAMILSVLQCLVAALATWRGSQGQAMPDGTTGPAQASQDMAKQLMSSVRRALHTLPTNQADLLWGSLERLCEDYDQQEGREACMAPSAEAGGVGWLSEALHGLKCED